MKFFPEILEVEKYTCRVISLEVIFSHRFSPFGRVGVISDEKSKLWLPTFGKR